MKELVKENLKDYLQHFAFTDSRWNQETPLPHTLGHPRNHFQSHGYKPIVVVAPVTHHGLNLPVVNHPRTRSKWYPAWSPIDGWKWLPYKPCYQKRTVRYEELNRVRQELEYFTRYVTYVSELEHRQSEIGSAYHLGLERPETEMFRSNRYRMDSIERCFKRTRFGGEGRFDEPDVIE
jgi:hypothetical protein